MYQNTMPLVNFSRESGWNPIEMWLLGASPVISGSTGLDNVVHTTTMFQETHKPKFCADKNGKVVDCNSPDRVQGGASGGDNNPIYGQNPKQSDSPYYPEAAIPNQSGEEQWLKDNPPKPGLVDDYSKRIFLGLLAIVLIAIAVISLR